MRTAPVRRSAGTWTVPSATSRSSAPIIPSQLEKLLVVPWPVTAWPLSVSPDMSSCREMVRASLFIALTFGLFRAPHIEGAPKPRPRTLGSLPLTPHPRGALEPGQGQLAPQEPRGVLRLALGRGAHRLRDLHAGERLDLEGEPLALALE